MFISEFNSWGVSSQIAFLKYSGGKQLFVGFVAKNCDWLDFPKLVNVYIVM